MKNIILFISVFVLLLSCKSETEDSLFIDQVNGETATTLSRSRIDNAPEQSGFIVTRGEGEVVAILLIDFDAGLTASFGVDNALFCNPFPNFDAFQVLPIQQVDIPNAPNRLKIIHQGSGYFEVYDGIINEFLCDFIQNTPLIAYGMADVIVTDNDRDAYLPHDNKNHNASALIAKGILTDQNGDPVEFKANYQLVWDGSDPNTIKEHAKISLN